VAPLLLAVAAFALAGCGKSSPSPAEQALEREDLVFVARALQSLEGQTNAEVAATRAAWPFIVNGLPARTSGLYPPQVRAAIENAERLQLPLLFDEKHAAELTGEAASIAGLYRAFTGLTSRGWQMIGAAIYQIEHGQRPSARFARANTPLYIDGLYDGHFGLGQLGKKLLASYKKLGGEKVFGVALTQAEVNALANTYSGASDRLEPHVGVKLGS
jgi:hypothetical protein